MNDTTGEPSEPNAKQALAHETICDELCYGGAAGGGKSEWLLMEAGSTCLEHAGVEVALFRRTFEELEASLILRSQSLFHGLVDAKLARYEAGRKRWVFRHPKGHSYLWFRYCAREADVYRYQSAQWVMLGLDEATHFTEFQYQYLTSRVRSRYKGVTVKIRLATNPGNVGHAWVKRRFIKPESVETGGVLIEPGTVWKPLPPPERPTLKTMTRCFIPARLHDNTALMESDPEYFNRLQQLPEDERRMLSEGDWDVWKGQMFHEFTELHRVTEADFELQAAGLTIGTVIPWHKIPDGTWEPPPGATIHLSVDYGYAAPWAAYVHAVLPGGRVITFKEFYLTRKRDFQQARLICAYLQSVWQRQRDNGQSPWDVAWCVMDQSMWGSRLEQGLGKSLAEVYEDELGLKTGILLKPGSRDRHARVQRVKHALSTAPDGFPWWQITAACPNLLRTLPELPHDTDDPEDVDCWAAGTRVETPSGPRRIETVAPGDLVSTPIGARPVLRAYCSGASATVMVRLGDGRVLQGTPHHPVCVRGKGLVPLEQLACGDVLVENDRWSRWWSIAGSSIAAIRGACITTLARRPFIVGRPASIDKSGSIAVARFPPAGIFTIATATTTIINSRIWTAFRGRSIRRSIYDIAWPVTLDDGSRRGVSRSLAGPRFARMPGKCSNGHLDTNRRAAIVAALFWPVRIRSIVRTCVNRLGVTRWPWCVPCAVRRFGRSLMPRDRYAPARIVAVGRSDVSEPVYNLTVADAHLFYANGVLSSNTDAEDHAYDSVGLFWQARPELPKPTPIYHTYANLDQLSRDHALVMQKRYDQKRKPGTLNPKGFILG